MLFTNITFFFFFFPLCVIIYYFIYFLQQRCPILKVYRLLDLFLAVASMAFYSWTCVTDIFKLLFFCFIVYSFGYLIQVRANNSKKKKYVIGVIGVLTVSILFYYYKYLNFSIKMLNIYAGTNVPLQSIVAPLGTSFIAFSAISYIVDIKRGDVQDNSLLDTIIYLLFFPKVISGPIVLWKDFRSQLADRNITIDYFLEGLNRIMIGMAKKLILADEFGRLLSYIQSDVGYGIDILSAVGGGVIYALQIYYDFSGYSDIAIGLAKIFGFQMKENFNFPYISKSITEFWRRWHISLGQWFKEYIYIPLGGNRKGKIRTLFNLFIIFLLTGIWHEDGRGGLHYVIWGLIHGICIVTERCIINRSWYKKIPDIIKHIYTLFIVFMGWQIFRLPELHMAVQYFKIMFGQIRFSSVNFTYQYYFDRKMIILMVIGILGCTVLSSKTLQILVAKCNDKVSLFIAKEILLFLLAAISIMCMVNSTYSPFLYFKY